MSSARERKRKAALAKSRALSLTKPLVDVQAEKPRRVAAPQWKASDRDGLLWLLERGRLTQRQATAAHDYRFAYRVEGGVPLKSCLDPEAGVGGGGRTFQPPALETPLDAKRWLFEMRYVVLKGETSMVDVLDAVCGRGLTVRDHVGQDSYRANASEALLKAALNMLAEHLDPKLRSAA